MKNHNLKITNEGIQISQGRVKYYVDWDRIKTEKELIDWVTHLSSKRWITKELLIELVLLVNKHQGLDYQIKFRDYSDRFVIVQNDR